jgi:hypothetical protein
MKEINTMYTDSLKQHYELFYGTYGNIIKWNQGPIHKLHPDFYVLEIGPSKRHDMWTYATVGMSLDRDDENLIELITYSKKSDISRVESLVLNASLHRNSEPLNLHHTVFMGELDDLKTACDHGFISLPYIEGSELELFRFGDNEIHCYWYIPITKEEREFKVNKGCEALEQLFEDSQFDYCDFNRKSLV